MIRRIMGLIASCVVAIALEYVLFNVYSYINVLNGNAPLSFSVARVVAILVIYWGTKGLMLLQKSPDYEIE